MTISSRTPEGHPYSCPLCRSAVLIEPFIFIGDATCPKCGQLLWYMHYDDRTRIFDLAQTRNARDRVLDIIANQLGVDRNQIANNPQLLQNNGTDSLDTVELVMALEEETPE